MLRQTRWLWINLFLFVAFSLTSASGQQSGPDIPKAHSPASQADIANLLRSVEKADRVEVFNVSGLSIGNRLYVSEARNDIATLRASLRSIAPAQLCACAPIMIIKLYRQGTAIGQMEIISGDEIWFSGWTGDGRITQRQAWFDWLDSHGITRPRREFEAEHK